MHLLIADDHTLFRDALSQFIRRHDPDIAVTLARSLQETLDILNMDSSIDLVLLDLRMPGMFGLEGLSRMHDRFPDCKVAILSGTAEEDDIRAALDIGAMAYFPKTMSGASLIKGIQLVLEGERFIPLNHSGSALMSSYHIERPGEAFGREEANKRIIRTSVIASLTPREKQVLTFLSQGASNQEIADALNLQLATIKLHVRGVCRKLNARNRTQAALIAQTMGFTDS